MVMQGLQTLPLCCAGLTRKINVRAMIAPSWPKVVRPAADGKDLATVNWSILRFTIDKTVDLLWLVILQHRPNAPLPRHMINMY